MVAPARLSLALSARKIVLMVFAVLYAATFAIGQTPMVTST